MPPVSNPLFGIRCDTESARLISSKIESEAWESIETLVEFLRSDEDIAVKRELFSWKYEMSHLASAKETYAWRKVIDSIKASDLGLVGSEFDRSRKTTLTLAKSKPIMLRIAGEITNALLHSYSNRHRITYFQCDS